MLFGINVQYSSGVRGRNHTLQHVLKKIKWSYYDGGNLETLRIVSVSHNIVSVDSKLQFISDVIQKLLLRIFFERNSHNSLGYIGVLPSTEPPKRKETSLPPLTIKVPSQYDNRFPSYGNSKRL